MTIGVVGRKTGMTRIFTEDGASIPVTVIEVSPNRITQVRDAEKDGYRAVQVTTGERRARRVTKAQAGHFAKAGSAPGRGLWEFRVADDKLGDFAIGGEIDFTGGPGLLDRGLEDLDLLSPEQPIFPRVRIQARHGDERVQQPDGAERRPEEQEAVQNVLGGQPIQRCAEGDVSGRQHDPEAPSEAHHLVALRTGPAAEQLRLALDLLARGVHGGLVHGPRNEGVDLPREGELVAAAESAQRSRAAARLHALRRLPVDNLLIIMRTPFL